MMTTRCLVSVCVYGGVCPILCIQGGGGEIRGRTVGPMSGIWKYGSSNMDNGHMGTPSPEQNDRQTPTITLPSCIFVVGGKKDVLTLNNATPEFQRQFSESLNFHASA